MLSVTLFIVMLSVTLFIVMLSVTSFIVIFVQLGFNLSNGVPDRLESSSILIYLIQVRDIYTQKVALIQTGI
jgi:hypothetical protein